MKMSIDGKQDAEKQEQIKPGTYSFLVAEVEERTREKNNAFKSGNEGVALTLAVGALPNRDIKVFDYLVNTANSMWKIKQFCQALDLPVNGSVDTDLFLGKAGKARFRLEEAQDGKSYLRVERYIGAGDKSAESKSGKDDDVPF